MKKVTAENWKLKILKTDRNEVRTHIITGTITVLYKDKAGLDLVIVSKDAKPPVCKILDYGKYKYEQQKKKAEAKKKQKTIDLKEVQIRPFIGENDLMVKCKAIKRFIEAGNKVKLVMRFRGREMSRQDIGQEVINKVFEFCQDFAKTENPPKLEGTVMMTILSGK